MKVPQGNSLCSYLKQSKKSFSSSFLIQNQRTGEQNRSYLGELVSVRGVNMVQILCTHVCKWENDTC
jgi:hypothetical protein